MLFALIVLLLCVSCVSGSALLPDALVEQPEAQDQQPEILAGQLKTPIEQSDGTLTWNGFKLKREEYFGRAEDVFVPENVLTTDEQTLSVFFSSGFGSDELEYGIMEFIQVNLDGVWYTLMDEQSDPPTPLNLSQTDVPLILPPFDSNTEYQSEASRMEHTVDFSVIGGLPAGRYRLVERFFLDRLKLELHTLAHFWVIEPGDKRPPESEPTGAARLEDILFYVDSPYKARQEITDADYHISTYIENLSGKRYVANSAILEMKQNGRWVNVDFQHANLGLLSEWTGVCDFMFLDEPLIVGDYRLRLSISILGMQDVIEPECEFAVIAYEDAPKPKWVSSQLKPSPYNVAEQSTGISITLKNAVLDKENMELEFVIEADSAYSFGEPYELDVLLDGTWYSVPLAFSAFNSIGYAIDPDTEIANRTYKHTPVFSVGILPAGQYRLIKAFNLTGPDEPKSGMPTYLTNEFALAEFSVAETLEWLG